MVKVDSTGSLALIAEKKVELQDPFRKDTANIFNPLGITTHNSAFPQHLHNSPHSFRPTENIMDILHIIKKGNYITTLQKLYTHSDTKNNNHGYIHIGI
jgi:hypothetical protein